MFEKRNVVLRGLSYKSNFILQTTNLVLNSYMLSSFNLNLACVVMI